MKDQPVTQIPIPSKQKTYNVMHFTDIHVDLTYTVGNNAACDQSYCCRAENGPTSDVANQAKFWGTPYHSCDIPARTAEATIKFAAENLDIDMIIYTGDNNDHNVWEPPMDNMTHQTA